MLRKILAELIRIRKELQAIRGSLEPTVTVDVLNRKIREAFRERGCNNAEPEIRGITINLPRIDEATDDIPKEVKESMWPKR